MAVNPQIKQMSFGTQLGIFFFRVTKQYLSINSRKSLVRKNELLLVRNPKTSLKKK